jgi:hypothetical protein
METVINYFVEYQKRFENYNDKQLLKSFNREVNNAGSGSARFCYLAALHEEFIRRGYDYSAIGDSKSLSFRDKIRLKDNTIIKIKTREKFDPGL